MAHPAEGYKVDGVRIPGTTTITGRYKESGGLMFWACKQGQKYPNLPPREAMYGEKAAEVGTAVHTMVEVHNKGGAADITGVWTDGQRQQIQSGFDAYLAWERMTRLKITHQEIPLVSIKHLFGGCPDAVGEIEGQPCLLDWKTSNSVYSDYLLQLAAYGHLCEHGVRVDNGRPLGIRVGGFHLCRFSKLNGDFSHHYYPSLDLEWEQFKLLRRAYANDQIIRKRAA